MIKIDNVFTLTVNDYLSICSYFKLNPKTVIIKIKPSMTTIETMFVDIYTNEVLFSFFSHDGLIRIPKTKNDFYTKSVSSIMKQNDEEPSKDIMGSIRSRMHKPSTAALNKIKNTITK